MSEPKDMPARWAFDEAAKRSGFGDWDDVPTTHLAAVRAHACTILTHEQPPVDPDVLAVREILAVWYGADRSVAKEVNDGVYDNDCVFQAAVTAYKRVKNGGVS